MPSIRVVSWSLGLLFAISFVLCVICGMIVPPRLHGMSVILEAMLPAFEWISFSGFILGLIETFYTGLISVTYLFLSTIT